MKKVLVDRIVHFCPRVKKSVNQEISIVDTYEKREIMTTCTGIEDSCVDCPFLLLNK